MSEDSRNTPGFWTEIDVSYVDPQRRSCALCGRPLAKNIWREEIEGCELDFCEPSHAALYQSYWLPLYGIKQ